LLLGMAYLFGVTGEMRLDRITQKALEMTRNGVPALLTFAGVLIVTGLLFKMAAAPLHFYVGDVYQGAATPVTAAISYIPKIAGTAALVKVLYALGGGQWVLDPKLIKLLVAVAVLTMTVGNVLALLQYNVKRVFAYSSVAHSGYILVGIASLALLAPEYRADAVGAIAFYMLAYGIMNTAAFGVLMMLPAGANEPALTAETYDDIQGSAKRHPILALAMTLCCLSLIGVPATIGFFGKLYIVRPAIQSGDTQLLWLAVLTMVNAVISAAYYLKIIATMWSLAEPEGRAHAGAIARTERPLPVMIAVGLSAAATLVFGVVLPLAGALYHKATTLTLAIGS
jgi:NADH-quinone oxidoreductase subunit N